MKLDFNCPCKGCDSRNETCHAVCAKYAEWKLRRAEENEAISKRMYNYNLSAKKGGRK